MAKDPAFLFYSSDFITGTQFFTNEQKGQYITLLCLQHQQGHLYEKHLIFICGSLDNDVCKKFIKDSSGLYYNERLEKEAAKRKNFCESRGKNKLGKKSLEPLEAESHEDHMSLHMENENENINEDVKGNKTETANVITAATLQSFVDDWNVYADGNSKPKIKILTEPRKKKLLSRMKEREFKFREILEKANNSTFIRDGTWFTFDWILAGQTNYLKVLEGNYNGTGTTKNNIEQHNKQVAAELAGMFSGNNG